jgi:hypothetical protein
MATNSERFTSAADAYDHHVGRYGARLAADQQKFAICGLLPTFVGMTGVSGPKVWARPFRR